MQQETPKIIEEYPPNWEKVKALFPVDNAEVVMAYDGAIYNPFKLRLRDDLIYHEMVHIDQQTRAKDRGIAIEEWWERYAKSPERRIELEAQAYGKQVAYIKKTQGEVRALQALKSFSRFLAGPVYGNAISEASAREKLRIIYRQNLKK